MLFYNTLLSEHTISLHVHIHTNLYIYIDRDMVKLTSIQLYSYNNLTFFSQRTFSLFPFFLL